MITIVHSNERLKYVELVESIIGFGDVIGPLVGSIIEFTKPSILDQDYSEEFNQIENQEEALLISDSEPKISFCKLFSEPSVILLSFEQCITSIAYCYFEPVLTFRLLDFTSSVRIQGLVIGCLAIGYSIASIFVSFFAKFMIPTT